jgi:hypothetical protein
LKCKALFLSDENRPYNDIGDLLQIARAEGRKILGTDKVQVLNILHSHYPSGYVVVVQSQGGNGKHNEHG